MRKTFLSSLFSEFLELSLDSSRLSSPYKAHLFFLLHFSQTLSPLVRLQYPQFTTISDSLIPGFVFYSNFANLLSFIKSPNLFLLFYGVSISVIFYPLIYILTVTLLRTRNSKTLTNRKLCSCILEYYNFALIIPIIDIIINPLDCDWYSYSGEDCSKNNLNQVMLGIGIFSITWAVFQNYLLNFSLKNYRFSTGNIDLEWGIIRWLIISLRMFIIIFYFLLKKSELAIYFILYLFSVLSFIEIYLNKPSSSQRLLTHYLQYLCLFQGWLIVLSLLSYSYLIDSSNLFYFLCISAVFAQKLGKKLSRLKKNPDFLIFNEEFPSIFAEIKLLCENVLETAGFFSILGFFMNHFRRSECQDLHCLQEFKPLFLQNSKGFLESKQLNAFITKKFEFLISKKEFMTSKNTRKNELILKYIDFLQLFAKKPKKLLFNFEKLKQKMAQNSFFLRLYLTKLDHLIKESVLSQALNQGSEKVKQQNLQIRDFFKMNKYKTQFVALIKAILRQKRTFWSDYLLGFKNMDVFVAKLQHLTGLIESFRVFIEQHQTEPTCKIITMKASSVLFSIFRNELSVAMKLEEEYQKVFLNELVLKQNSKEKLSFLDKNMIICEASFLDLNGLIKNTSKTLKFGKFFGLSKGEAEMVSSIEDLMPGYLRAVHSDFVRNYIQKSRISSANYPIASFAQHKQGYIFPVSISLCLQSVPDDFVISAALLYDEMNDDHLIVFNLKGEILGLSRKMISAFAQKVTDFNLNLFLQRNIFEAMPALNPLTKGENEFLMNQHGVLVIPIEQGHTFTAGTQTTSTVGFRKKTLASTMSYKTVRLDIDFDLKIYRHFAAHKQAIAVNNLSIKSLELSVEFNPCPHENPQDMSQSNEENIPISRHSEEGIRDGPKSFAAREKNPDFSAENTENFEPQVRKIDLRDRKPQDLTKMPPKEKDGHQKARNVHKEPDQNKPENLNSEANSHKDVGGLEEKSNPSHHSSVLQVQSKTFKVFVGIEKIKALVPKSFVLLLLGLFCEVFLMLTYYFILKTSVDDYFTKAFYPTQRGIIRFCEQYSAFAFSSAAMAELELIQMGITPVTKTDNYVDIYYRLLGRMFDRARFIVYQERNSEQLLSYQKIYLEQPSYLIDINAQPIRIKVVTYFDLLDYNLDYIQTVLSKSPHFTEINYNYLIFLQRNYPQFLVPSVVVFTEIKNCFLSTSVDIGSTLKQYIIIFIVIIAIIRIFKLFQILILYRVVTRLATIFLRCNQQEALREIHFIDGFLDFYEKSDDFFYLNFAEKALSKRAEAALFEEQQRAFLHSNQKALPQAQAGKPRAKPSSKRHLKKKYFGHTSNANLPAISRSKGFLFLAFGMSVLFAYFFLNYFYWTLFNNKVQEVIGLDTSFASAYVYTSSVLVCNNLLLREMIIKNPLYENLNYTYQTPTGRKTYLLAALNKRIGTITDIFNNEMPSRTIQAKGTVNDPNFNKLIDKDFCEVLRTFKVIEEDEFQLCGEIWEGAFKKGIMVGCSEYLKILRDMAPLRNLNANTTAGLVNSYLQDPKHQYLILGQYFLGEALILFYDYINKYYNPLIEQERYNTQVTLLFSMIFLGSLWILIAVVLGKFMRNYYRLLAMGLSVMPYEKVTEDEATIQIIESFTKK